MHKQNQGKPFSDYENTVLERQGIVSLWQDEDLFPPQALQSFLFLDPLTSLPPPPLPSPAASCHPSAAALPSSSAVFLTFHSSLATAVCSWEEELWTFCRQRDGQGSPSAHGWWLALGPGDTQQPQGNNFCTNLWLWPKTGEYHLILKLQFFFLLVNKRLLILLH